MLGKHLPRGESRPGGSTGASDMTPHGGIVMNTTYVQPIFWGSSWNGYTGDKITGIDSWYAGVGGTAYMTTNTEYTGTGGTKVTTAVSSAPSVTDFAAAPSRAPKTSDILNEVCKMISHPVTNGYYPVYVDTPRGHAGYCAWHSYGTCNGVDVQFGFFFNLDGDPGCDPQDASAGPPPAHSQGLAAIANVSGHELSEMVTDPRNGGWWDSSGQENGDKCAWTFSSGKTGPGAVKFSDGQVWKIQGNFSNLRNDAKTGYDGGGCIDGNQ